MKKIVLWMVVAACLVSTAALAEEPKKEAIPAGPIQGMGKMCSMMMGKTQMVATDEGGVIVLAGNRLMKFDADLNLVKEVEMKMSCPMMDKQCPMRGKTAGQETAPGQEASGMAG